MRDDLGVSVSCSTVHRSLMLLNQTRKKITKQVSCSHLGVCLIGACNAQLRIERFAHGLCRPCTQCIRKVTAIHTAHLLLIMGPITGSSAQDWVWRMRRRWTCSTPRASGAGALSAASHCNASALGIQAADGHLPGRRSQCGTICTMHTAITSASRGAARNWKAAMDIGGVYPCVRGQQVRSLIPSVAAWLGGGPWSSSR